jgi:hypothetical protein
LKRFFRNKLRVTKLKNILLKNLKLQLKMSFKKLMKIEGGFKKSVLQFNIYLTKISQKISYKLLNKSFLSLRLESTALKRREKFLH